MDINDNQQINTFTKGMNTDVSDALIDNSQYRYAENVRLITNTDSNSGELRLIEGTEITDTSSNFPWKSIIAMTSIRNYMIVIGKERKLDSLASYDGLSIFTNTNYGVGEWRRIVNKIPYEYFIQEGEEEAHLSLVTRWESENNIKLYIADGIHSIISLNITNDYTNIDNTNDLSDIIQYSEVYLDAPTVEIFDGGTLVSAKVQYAYRLYNIGEPATSASPLSKALSLYKTNTEGYGREEKTNKAAKITINTRGDTFDRLQIYRISYVVLNEEPTIDLVYDGEMVSTFIDYGSSISQMGASEFLSTTQLQIVPKVIESKNDYLFAANVKYEQDEFDKALEDLDFRSYSYGDWDNSADLWDYDKARNYNKQYKVNNNYGQPNYNVDYWKVSDTKLGGKGPIVSWEYIVKKVNIDENNEVKTGRQILSPYKDEYITEYSNIATESQRSLRRGEIYRYGIILYKKGGSKSSVKWIADIMIPDGNVDIYDPNKIYFSTNRPDLPTPYQETPWNGWIFSLFGIRFTIKTSDIQDCSGFEIVRCKRRYQDSYTISQGIVGAAGREVNITHDSDNFYQKDSEYIFSAGFITNQAICGSSDINSTVPTGGDDPDLHPRRTDRDYAIFASPEYAYQPDDVQDIIKENKRSLYLQDVVSYQHPTLSFPVPHSGTFPHTTEGCMQHASAGYNDGKYAFNNKYSPVIASITGGLNIYNHERISAFVTNFDSRNNGINDTSLAEIAAIRKLDNVDLQTLSIKEYGFPEVPDPQIIVDEVVQYVDKETPVGDSIFEGWIAQWRSGMHSHANDEEVYRSMRNSESRVSEYSYPAYGTIGSCIVFQLANQRNLITEFNENLLAPITVANLKKSAIPYGGPDSYKYNSSDYFSYGNYVPITGSIYSSIDVYDGDCYPGVFVYNAEHAFDNSLFITQSKRTIIYYVPVESDIELRATYGDLYNRIKNNAKSYYIQDKPCQIDGYVQDKDAYLYNTAYNADPDIFSFSSTTYTDIDGVDYDCRVHHSQLKQNNEHIDSWTEFKAADFIDVDSRFGEITNLRLFKDTMIYWQQNATGILSINERTILNDADNNNIILGTGDVLQRYDYISTLYGMKKNQYEAETQSNTTQYWWDGNNKEILAYAQGTQLVPLCKVKDVQNYINTHKETTRPSLSYDSKFNELISNVVTDESSTSNSIVYNEQVQQFTSIYTFNPIHRAIIDGVLYLSPNARIYKWNQSENKESSLFEKEATPLVKYIVNKVNTYNKVFDISTFGGRFYGGNDLDNLTFTFDTPLKQHSIGCGNKLITNREYDFRLDIPRNNNSDYGDRMRGKTMQCELSSSSNSTDFSLQYIVTKYRMSWS